VKKRLTILPVLCALGAQAATNITIEAENAVIVAPMAAFNDVSAVGGRAVVAQSGDTGTVSFTFNITEASVYNVWCRVLAPDAGTDSFYISMDGAAEDIYDTARVADNQNVYSQNWQWNLMGGRGGISGTGAIIPLNFNLGVGNHTLRFRAREVNSKLDQLIITNTNSVPPPPTTNNYPNYLINASLTVAWDYPTNAMTNIATFVLYRALGEVGAHNAIVNTLNKTATVTNSTLGVNKLMVTARSIAGLESDPSNELRYNVVTSTNPPVKPRPPRNVRVQ
jgi:hypothetical protein